MRAVAGSGACRGVVFGCSTLGWAISRGGDATTCAASPSDPQPIRARLTSAPTTNDTRMEAPAFM